jgi:hypothetical protein
MKIRLKSQDRQTHRRLCADHQAILFDTNTRLSNALFALSQSDPNWLIWLESVDASRPACEIMRTVEARARAIVLKSYPALNRTSLIFSDYPFSYNGNLIMG